MSGAKDRQKRHRDRIAAGRAIVRIEIDTLAVPDWLVEKGFLQAWDAHDRAKVAAAVERALCVLSRYA